MLEIGFWIYIIVTLPLWGLLTLIWTILKGVFFLFIYIISIFLSIFEKTFDFWNTIFVGLVRFIAITFDDFNMILKWFENFYYENTFFAFILAFVCFLIFFGGASRIQR